MSIKVPWAGVALDVCVLALVILGAHLEVIDKTTCAGITSALVGARVIQIRAGGGPKGGGPVSGSLTMLLLVYPLVGVIQAALGNHRVT